MVPKFGISFLQGVPCSKVPAVSFVFQGVYSLSQSINSSFGAWWKIATTKNNEKQVLNRGLSDSFVTLRFLWFHRFRLANLPVIFGSTLYGLSSMALRHYPGSPWPPCFYSEAYHHPKWTTCLFNGGWVDFQEDTHGGFKYLLLSPLFEEDSHFDKYFSNGLKPSTSLFCWTWTWHI